MGFDLKEYNVRKATGEEVLVRNIYCIGRNYIEHAKELNHSVPNEPFFFQKSLPSLNITDTIYLPVNREIHYEVEIVLLIGKSGVSQSVDDSLSFINGFTIGIDLTDRNFQNILKEKQLPWLLSKSFSGSAVVSEFIDEEISDNFWIKPYMLSNIENELTTIDIKIDKVLDKENVNFYNSESTFESSGSILKALGAFREQFESSLRALIAFCKLCESSETTFRALTAF